MNKQKKSKLSKVTCKNVRRFTLKGVKTIAKVVSVHSGDSCDLVFYRGERMVRYKCRLSGYNAPDLDDEPNDELARDYLASLCMNENGAIDQFLDDTLIWGKKLLQGQLDANTDLVHATFGKFREFNLPLVTLKQFSPKKSINHAMKMFIERLEQRPTIKQSDV